MPHVKSDEIDQVVLEKKTFKDFVALYLYIRSSVITDNGQS